MGTENIAEGTEVIKKTILIVAVLTISISLSAVNLMAQGDNSTGSNEDQKKASPFLISGKLPHLTKLLIKQWDNPELNLSSLQKTKLLVVRKETIANVQALTAEIIPLESKVAEGIFAKKTPEELKSMVETIANLKAQATMVHLRCIYNTREVLEEQQLNLLLKL